MTARRRVALISLVLVMGCGATPPPLLSQAQLARTEHAASVDEPRPIDANLAELARHAVNWASGCCSGPSPAAQAIDALRAAGPAGLDALMAVHAQAVSRIG